MPRLLDIEGLTGSRLGGYQLLRCLGHGTHTAVYHAAGSRGSDIALKVIHRRLDPEPGLAERLRRTAAQLSRSDARGILQIQEVGRDEEVTLATMPLLEAKSLEQLMSIGSLDTELAWSLLTQVADALERVHQLGLAYRVLKPCNVLVDAAGHAHLAEFAITSRHTGPVALSTPDYRLGWPQYLAPEQVAGQEPDWRTDVYSVGVLVFELLTGTPLFSGESVAAALAATARTPPPSARARKPSLPATVDWVLRRALSKDPARRQRSVWELLDELIDLPEYDGPAGGRVPGSGRATREGAEHNGGGQSSSGPPDSALAMLRRMGIPHLEHHQLPVLNSFFALVVRHGRVVAGSRWADVVDAAGLPEYLVSEPHDGNRTTPAEHSSRLAEAFQLVFGAEAPDHEHRWGRLVMEEWMRTTQPRRFRLFRRVDTRVADTLYVVTQSLDRVRGEQLHVWKQTDHRQFWIIHHGNLFAVGRRKPAQSCHFWIGAYEAALTWGGIQKEWSVEETECACVTGTGSCVYAVERSL